MKNNETKEIFVPCKYIRENGTVLDFTGLYEVSNLGRVRSLNYRHTGKTRELSQGKSKAKDHSLRYIVTLYNNNKKYSILVHRLVLSSFDPEGFRHGPIVNHKVERTAESCINEFSNLEWATQKANLNTDHYRTLQSKAMTNHPTKSKKVKVTNLKTGQVTIYPSAMEAGRSLGINPRLPTAYISNCNGYCKKLNLHFEYAK